MLREYRLRDRGSSTSHVARKQDVDLISETNVDSRNSKSTKKEKGGPAKRKTSENSEQKIFATDKKIHSTAKVGILKRSTSLNQLRASDIANVAPMNPWVNFNVSPQELRLSATLTNGQCFNWMVVHQDVDELNMPWSESIDSNKGVEKLHTELKATLSPSSSPSRRKSSAWGTFNETQWLGVLRLSHDPDRCLVLTLKETRSSSWYRVLYIDPNTDITEHSHGTDSVSDILHSYFQLRTPLAPLYEYWSNIDTRLSRIAQVIPGVRIVQQDPVECLFSFLCSSNNNIPRITKILADCRHTLGRQLVRIESNHKENGPSQQPVPSFTFIDIYSFPTLSQWSTVSEDSLRNLGLGYRAKYVIQTRDLLSQLGGEQFLYQLRKYNTDNCDQYDSHIQDQLTQFSGVGKKVADCMALFSLDQTNSIPVDIHVQQIASRDYDANILSGKSLTPTVYRQVGNLFRTRFGVYAGWAHSLLFVAELPSFRDALPSDMVEEMEEWSKKEKEKKSAVKRKRKTID